MFRNILSVIVGLVVASATMLLFEFTNSRFFPFPVGLDVMSVESVRAFTDSLPWTAFILVLLGWLFGSFLGGLVMGKIAVSKNWLFPIGVGVLLTALGVYNNVLLGAPAFFTVIGFFAFIPTTLWGWNVAKGR